MSPVGGTRRPPGTERDRFPGPPIRNRPRAGSVERTMTEHGTGAFEAFRKAESLIAQRRPLDALAVLGPVLDAEPDKPSVHLLAGRAYLGSAQLRRAEMAFRRVIELDPTDHYALFALGKTLQRMSRLTGAQDR